MTATKLTPQLLVSVRRADEVAAALAGGADLIDVKEPARGALGAAEAEVVAAVLEAVAGRVPVSAALGEWSEHALVHAHWHLELPLRYVKWGLAGYPFTPGWGEDLLEVRRQLPLHTDMVLVAYADYERAKAIPPQEVARFARRYRFAAFLLDTGVKDGKTLLDFLPPPAIAELIQPLQRIGIIVALGGGLRPEHLKQLRGICPNYFAVRGSVCAGSKRTATIDPVRVRKWKEALQAVYAPASA
ncbi:MAG: (5-formylfuran-3-yl)methyl phosphate synthase [Gemmataceae bacterium]|nr:(5-formylfuran-3-yl)methyl phosphate synthase [Gemmataceae bacterium]MCS7271564.1 (5-formylfuran-3-yl)methyl phosphate synthase [Gemmataceae bacterium]